MTKPLLIPPEDLVAKLAAYIKENHSTWKRDAQWTAAIKRHIAEIFKSAGASDVRFTDRGQGIAEFLLDLCALSGGEMELGMECEWRSKSLTHLGDDFEKLLHVKAPVKLVICDSPSFVREKLQPAKNLISAYSHHRLGEQYIILNCRCNCGVVNCHVWRPTADGAVRPEDVHFKSMLGFPRVFNEEIWQKQRSKPGHRGDAWLAETDLNSIGAPTDDHKESLVACR